MWHGLLMACVLLASTPCFFIFLLAFDYEQSSMLKFLLLVAVDAQHFLFSIRPSPLCVIWGALTL